MFSQSVIYLLLYLDSSTSSSDEEEESLEKLHDNWVDELQRKREHPERIHPELWFNEPMEVNMS